MPASWLLRKQLLAEKDWQGNAFLPGTFLALNGSSKSIGLKKLSASQECYYMERTTTMPFTISLLFLPSLAHSRHWPQPFFPHLHLGQPNFEGSGSSPSGWGWAAAAESFVSDSAGGAADWSGGTSAAAGRFAAGFFKGVWLARRFLVAFNSLFFSSDAEGFMMLTWRGGPGPRTGGAAGSSISKFWILYSKKNLRGGGIGMWPKLRRSFTSTKRRSARKSQEHFPQS